MKYLIVLSLVVVTAYSSISSADDCAVDMHVRTPISERNKLVFSLLELSLSKAGYTPCFHFFPAGASLVREVELVKSEKASLLWASAGPLVERELRAVRIPIFKGLTGFRLLLINIDDRQTFSKIHTLNELKKMRVGVGEQWGDRFVFEASGLSVVPLRHWTLQKMLIEKRFDYLTMGLHEQWASLEKTRSQLMVEPNLLLKYPMATYFYLAEENDTLVDALTDGMEKAIQDGSYDRILYGSGSVQRAAKELNIQSRRIIELPHSAAPADTPWQREEYWVDLNTFSSDVARIAP